MKTLILMVGLPRSGKCLKNNTLINTDNGLQYINEITKNSKTCTFNNINNINNTFNRTTEKTVKLTTSIGNIIEGTYNHKLLVFTGDSFIYKTLDEIQLNDVLCIKYDTNIFNNNLQPIDYIYEGNSKSHSKKIITPKNMNIHVAKLLGYLIANGSKSNTNIQFSTNNKYIINDFNNSLNTLGLKLSKDNLVCSIKFVKLIEYLYGSTWTTARFKKIPIVIRKSSRDIQLNFIQALIDCDSYLDKNKNTLEYYTASEQLARELHIMLLNFGIVTSIHIKYSEKYNHNYYTLRFISGATGKFLGMINSIKYKGYKTNINTINPTIYNLHNIFYNKVMDIKNELNVRANGIYENNKRFKLFKNGLRYFNDREFTYYTLKKYIDTYEYNNDYKSLNSIIEFSKKILNKSLFFVKVINKEYINNEQIVYDIEVENEHNFIANGIISHNSSWAKVSGHPIVSADAIQYAMCGKHLTRLMDFICMGQTFSEYMIRALFIAGHDTVILDDCNINIHERSMWTRICKENNWELKFKHINTSKEVCIERAKRFKNADILIPIIEELSKEQTKWKQY